MACACAKYAGKLGACGDDAMSMLMGELAAAVKYKLPIKMMVVKNNTLGQIKCE